MQTTMMRMTADGGAPSSTVHSIGDFGMLHCCSLPPQALDMLRAHCMRTTPDAVHSADGLFQPQVRALLHQGHLNAGRLICVKLHDGYAVVTGQQHRIVSLIKDAQMCAPQSPAPFPLNDPYYGGNAPDDDDDGQGPRQNFEKQSAPLVPVMGGARITITKMNGANAGMQRSHCFSLVQHPQMPTMRPITLVHHDGLIRSDEASRYASVDSIISQLVGHMPLPQQPRMLTVAPSMGSLTGRNLMGPEADFVKRVFLEGISQARAGQKGPSGIYHTPIAMSETLSKMLMLRQPSKPICCARLSDGIVGYRERSDGNHSLVFLGSSDDFNRQARAPVDQSRLKLIKITYNSSHPKAPRVFLHLPGDGGPPRLSEYGTPPVIPDTMCVADVESIIEHCFRVNTRASSGCSDYPAMCRQAAEKHLRADLMNQMNDVHSDACRRVLAAMPAACFSGGLVAPAA